MTARKPHFFNVSHRFVVWILAFEMSQPSPMGVVGAVGVGWASFAARHLMALDTLFVIMVCWAVPCTRFETTSLRQWGPFLKKRMTKRNIYPHTMFVKGQSMAEVPDIIIHLSEWQPTRYQPHWINGIPDVIRTISARIILIMERQIKYRPYPDKLDLNVDWKCSLESRALFPTLLVVGNIHLVCERHLLVIAYWQETDL